MLISTETGSFSKLGSIQAILRVIKDAGFTAYDYTMCSSISHDVLYADNYLEKAKEVRDFADGIGLPCNQTHAPFPTARKNQEDYNNEIFPVIVRAIEISGILGAKVCVVHPCNDYTAEENYEIYQRLEPYARAAGVKIGLENMWNWREGGVSTAACSHHADFRKHLEMLPADVFVACLDIGHAELQGLDTSAVQMIETLNERLEAIHLHDVDFFHDNHSLPFTQKTDFNAVINAFRKVGYKGDITLESLHFFDTLPVELLPSAAKYAASVANYFCKKIKQKIKIVKKLKKIRKFA